LRERDNYNKTEQDARTKKQSYSRGRDDILRFLFVAPVMSVTNYVTFLRMCTYDDIRARARHIWAAFSKESSSMSAQ